MTIFHLVLALVIVAFAAAQGQQQQQQQQQQQVGQQPRAVLGNIDVPVKIENHTFNVRFEPELHSAREMAQQLCTQRASMIGVTQETLGVCVDKVGTFLQTNVDRWVSEKTMNVPLTIDDKTFQLQFIPERSDTGSVSKKFCTEQSAVLGITAETLNNCVASVNQYLTRQVNNFFVEKTMQAPVTIDGQTFQLSFMPERHPSVDVARKLCVDASQALKLTTDEMLGVCVEKVTQNLNQQVDMWVNSKTMTMPLTLNGKTLNLSFMPERQSALAVAREVCVARAQDLGLSETTIVSKCVTPLTDLVRKQVDQWVDSKRLVVPVTVGEQSVRISLFPERESSVAVARRFCVNNAAALSLTNENVVANCIAPLNDIVAKAINQWAEARIAAQQQQQQQVSA